MNEWRVSFKFVSIFSKSHHLSFGKSICFFFNKTCLQTSSQSSLKLSRQFDFLKILTFSTFLSAARTIFNSSKMVNIMYYKYQTRPVEMEKILGRGGGGFNSNHLKCLEILNRVQVGNANFQYK